MRFRIAVLLRSASRLLRGIALASRLNGCHYSHAEHHQREHDDPVRGNMHHGGTVNQARDHEDDTE